MKQTIYKIVNSNARKTFSSLDELKAHVKAKDIKPVDMSSTLRIEKITTETIKFDVEVPKLSKEGAIKFLTNFKASMVIPDYLVFDSTAIKFFIHDVFTNEKYKNDILTEFLYNKVQEMGFTEDVLKSYDTWYGVDGLYAKFTKIFTEYIGHVIENIDELFDKAEWIKVMTDYKPCNGVGMRIKLGRTTIHFLNRQGVPLISTWEVYGRNVNHRGTMFLTDKDV